MPGNTKLKNGGMESSKSIDNLLLNTKLNSGAEMETKFMLIILLITLLMGCTGKVPVFDEDNAYLILQDQCDLGYRLPGSPEIALCRDYITSKLQQYGAEISLQNFTIEFEGNEYEGINITGHFYPELSRRVLLGAHYDTRPWSDKDEDEAKHEIPVTGANDGASGVAVLLEMGRILSGKMPEDP
jgi:hypothetical protein